MEDHAFLYSTIGVFGLLTIATVIHGVSKRFGVSYTVGLLTAGVLIHIITETLGVHFASVEFSPEIVFYVFLPTLIFESAYHLNFRSFRNVFLEVSVLATLGLLISLAIIGFSLYYWLNFPLGVALLFGAMISATDPVAVLSIFRELRAPKKLSTIVDGESMLNDGTALVLFQFFLVHWESIDMGVLRWEYAWLFFNNIFFGVMVGILLGRIFSAAIAHSRTKGVQITLSVILAHVTFLLAEGILGVSGILATMAAGIVMGSTGKRKLHKNTKRSFTDIWQFLEFVSNSLIFLLLGLKLGQFPIFDHWELLLIATFITIGVARPASVFTSFFFINFFRKPQDRNPLSYQVLTVWGGIRGALAAAAVLLIPADFPYLAQFYSMTTGVILATFFLKATTIPYWLKKFQLVQLSSTETLQRLEAKILVNEKVCQFLRRMREKMQITDRAYESMIERYGSTGTTSAQELKFLQKKLLLEDSRESEKVLTHFALGIEIKAYNRLFELREISESRYEILLGSIFRQVDRLEKDILPNEDQFARKYAPNICAKKCPFWWLKKFYKWQYHKQILERYQHYRARRIASWQVILDFESLKTQHDIFTQSKVVDKILKRYRNWQGGAIKKVQHLENQYPNTITPFCIHMAENVCLKKERIIKQELLEKCLISEKVSQKMEEEISVREDSCERRLKNNFPRIV